MRVNHDCERRGLAGGSEAASAFVDTANDGRLRAPISGPDQGSDGPTRNGAVRRPGILTDF